MTREDKWGTAVDGFTQDVNTQQNIWGFGQVVSIGLLVLPLVSFFGKYDGLQFL